MSQDDQDWWRASVRARPLARLLGGWTGPLLWTGAGLAASGCAGIYAETEPDIAQAAFQSQQYDGWSVGDEGSPLAFPGAQAADISGGHQTGQGRAGDADDLGLSDHGFLSGKTGRVPAGCGLASVVISPDVIEDDEGDRGVNPGR